MEPTVRLRLGDLFDGPSDLIALPCSTAGTITGFVARSLVHHSIPHPSERMELGTVEIVPFEGADNIAQYVGFAASVRGRYSTVPAIESIGQKLGQFTRDHPSVRAVSAPLLGAGAGGLRSEKVVAALKAGFCATAASHASLTIHVLHRDVYERLRNDRPTETATTPSTESPRVFISHTSKSDEAVAWVKSLALYLIEHGIQARLDKFHLRRGMDLPQWMCNELAMAKKVIVVCDEAYKQKADGRLGGVGWETMIIQGDIASLPPESTKYQIIVRTNDIAEGTPLYLKTRYAFHAPTTDTSQSFRQELLNELLDVPIMPIAEANEFRL
ncbi:MULTISPECIES: toll/interleukin-1 receptor domain-containing protein [unclassified Bradyrhizobium]